MNFGNLLKIIILIIIFSVNINFAKAYNLNDAINSTLINNDQIQAAKKKLEIAILAKPKAMTEFLPEASTPIQSFHRCNLAAILITDLVRN